MKEIVLAPLGLDDVGRLVSSKISSLKIDKNRFKLS